MKPLPLLPPVDADAASQPFFDAAREGRLLVQTCSKCQTVQLGSDLCNHCHADALQWVPASGRAHVHSHVTMHLAYHAGLPAPYHAAVVELEEGPRLPVWMADGVSPRVGQAVTITFTPADNGSFVPMATTA